LFRHPKKIHKLIQDDKSVKEEIILGSGFTLIEIVITLSLAALLLPAIGRLYTFALNSSSQGDKYSKAYAYAQEGMETIYNIKKTNWDTLTESTSTTGEFTRSVLIYPVRRYADGELVDNLTDGSPDPFTKKVIVEVSWQGNSGVENVSITSYVTKH
jgi:prepilin-type N-terminal cleavage/methylation domain-containing protein